MLAEKDPSIFDEMRRKLQELFSIVTYALLRKYYVTFAPSVR